MTPVSTQYEVTLFRGMCLSEEEEENNKNGFMSEIW